jgi:hypothetical protein
MGGINSIGDRSLAEKNFIMLINTEIIYSMSSTDDGKGTVLLKACVGLGKFLISLEDRKMSLSNLFLKKIQQNRAAGDMDKVRKLEDALSHIDEASPCTAE